MVYYLTYCRGGRIMTLVRLGVKAQRDIRRKLRILNHAQQTGVDYIGILLRS